MSFLSFCRTSLLLSCLAAAPNVFADYVSFRGVVDTIDGPNAAGVRIGDPVSGSLVFTAIDGDESSCNAILSGNACSLTNGLPEWATVIKEQFNTPYGPAGSAFLDLRKVYLDDYGNVTDVEMLASGFSWSRLRWYAAATAYHFGQLDPLLRDNTWIAGPVTEFTHVRTPEPGTFGLGAVSLMSASVYLLRKRKLRLPSRPRP
jgi:hypothetical protein